MAENIPNWIKALGAAAVGVAITFVAYASYVVVFLILNALIFHEPITTR